MGDAGRVGRVMHLKVWGGNACFTRPEMKVERVSYDVMTPSAARGILDAIFWNPAMRWEVTQIDVLNPIAWETVRRNEIGTRMSPRKPHLFIERQRQQRFALFLRDVAYTIHARIVLTDRWQGENGMIRLEEMFRRRAHKGQSFHQPYLGCREFPASFELIPSDRPLPKPIRETRELGYLLHDISFGEGGGTAHFFKAALHEGRLKVPAALGNGGNP